MTYRGNTDLSDRYWVEGGEFPGGGFVGRNGLEGVVEYYAVAHFQQFFEKKEEI